MPDARVSMEKNIPTQQRTILLIDDEVDLIQVMRDLLEDAGYRILSATNGQDALHKLSLITPHLIILDMNMPKMGGIQFFRQIMNDRTGKPIYPVLVLTGRENLKDLFKDMEIDGFMTKPFQIEDLLVEIERIIMKRFGSAKRGGAPSAAGDAAAKKVLVIEDDERAFGKITTAFAGSGYLVNVARSAAEGFEKALKDPPDLFLIKLGLPDLPGDLTASKFRNTQKTKDIPIILYTPPNKSIDYATTDQICQRIGVKNFVESDEPRVLLTQANFILQQN